MEWVSSSSAEFIILILFLFVCLYSGGCGLGQGGDLLHQDELLSVKTHFGPLFCIYCPLDFSLSRKRGIFLLTLGDGKADGRQGYRQMVISRHSCL